MKDRITAVHERALAEISAAAGQREALEVLRIKYLGRKGEISELFKGISQIPPENKAEVGRLLNELKVSVTGAIEGSLASSSAKTSDHSRTGGPTLLCQLLGNKSQGLPTLSEAMTQ